MAGFWDFWQGKSASYFVNAQADAQDAGQLCQWLKNDNINLTSTSDRVQRIINKYKKDQNKIAIAAFGLDRINGYMDWFFATLIARITKYSLPQSKYYSISEFGWYGPTIPWLRIIWGGRDDFNRFLSKNKLTHIQVTGNELLIGIIQLQHINIQLNTATIKALQKNDSANQKVKQLTSLARESSDLDAFLSSAIKTQHAAIFWDKVYIRLLNVGLWLQARLKHGYSL